jgi:hypothetical protein
MESLATRGCPGEPPAARYARGDGGEGARNERSRKPGQDPPGNTDGTAKVADPYMNLGSSYVVLHEASVVAAADSNEEG